MRGYFGIGIEGLSKPMNAGNLFRSAHAFGADFIFAVAPAVDMRQILKSDTSRTERHVPFYSFPSSDALVLPDRCTLVGVELMDEAAALPSFTHPARAAYILGPERGSLSPGIVARCEHLVRIPTRFSVNVGIAGAILMYDRLLARGSFADRPDRPGGPVRPRPPHVHGH